MQTRIIYCCYKKMHLEQLKLLNRVGCKLKYPLTEEFQLAGKAVVPAL